MGHGVGVDVLAIPEGETAVRTLHLEPELLVEGDSDGVSKYENAAGSLPRSHRRRRRRAVGISDSVVSAEDAFAGRHGCADVHAESANAWRGLRSVQSYLQTGPSG